MDVSPAAPWIALAVVVALLLVGMVALLGGRRRAGPGRAAGGRTGTPAEMRGFAEDDLPRFLESPPGSAGRPVAPPGGWPALAATPPAPSGARAPEGRSRRRGQVVPTAVALAALLVVAAATVSTLAPRQGTPDPERAGGRPAPGTVALPPPPPAPTPGTPGAGDLADATVRPGPDGGAARLAFGGLVLEPRAVGITVTYPALEVTWNGRQAVAHLRLPTYNCLADTPPADPVAAGCMASPTEHADLPSPALAVTGDDGRVRLDGRFPTYLRPNGSPPVWTGRVYEFQVDAAPAESEPTEGWVRAEGEIRLGTGRAATLDEPDVIVLRRG